MVEQDDEPGMMGGERERGPELFAARAGHVRIVVGALGVAVCVSIPGMERYLALQVAYLLFGVAAQWVIERRVLRTALRNVVMGAVDMAMLSVFVQRLGTTTTVIPLVYVAAPVLYATTTRRRQLSRAIAAIGLVMYAALHVLEVLEILPYAPAATGALTPPTLFARFATFMLVAISCVATSILTSQLIGALGAANSRLRDLSQHDELTGLYNRRYVMQRLEGELARIKRKPGPLTVAMVDLDGFKRVNDEIGHAAGDAVLKEVSAALLSATRKVDVVARYGGDEFVVLFPDTESEGARAVSVRILDQARAAAHAVCPTIPVTASIGTTAVQASDEPTEVIRRVDEQLYAAKRAGGDRVYTR